MSIKLSDFLDINDINFEENSIFQELVKVSIVEENYNSISLIEKFNNKEWTSKNTKESYLNVEVDKDFDLSNYLVGAA
ncbi:hypothetical protein PML80_04285 [Aerococcus urinaeequi]|uniref:Uncharacterized protein n=1 Tax=Aerococcus urinaeequi TaxID=51665 RepID=A0AAF0BJR6_9LACT|nr:hypothetical protein [Aerococcus urinaeequi]WCG38552.1 hypothetical protein PML80_04285 [Aerococcus urinaeequi]